MGDGDGVSSSSLSLSYVWEVGEDNLSVYVEVSEMEGWLVVEVETVQEVVS